MTTTSYPFENQSTNESQYSKLFRLLGDTGVLGTPGDVNALKVQTKAGQPLYVTMATGVALVRGHYFECSVIETIQLAAYSGATRPDLIVLRLDPAANSIVPAVVSPGSLNSLTQTDTGIYEMPIASVTVSSAGIISVVDLRPWLTTRVGAVTSDTVRTGKGGAAYFSNGQPVWNHSRGYLEYQAPSGSWEPVAEGRDVLCYFPPSATTYAVSADLPLVAQTVNGAVPAEYNAAAGGFLCKEAGDYEVSGQIIAAGTGASVTQRLTVNVYKNGVGLQSVVTQGMGLTAVQWMPQRVPLVVGDILTLRIAASPSTPIADGPYATWLRVKRVRVRS